MEAQKNQWFCGDWWWIIILFFVFFFFIFPLNKTSE